MARHRSVRNADYDDYGDDYYEDDEYYDEEGDYYGGGEGYYGGGGGGGAGGGGDYGPTSGSAKKKKKKAKAAAQGEPQTPKSATPQTPKSATPQKGNTTTTTTTTKTSTTTTKTSTTTPKVIGAPTKVIGGPTPTPTVKGTTTATTSKVVGASTNNNNNNNKPVEKKITIEFGGGGGGGNKDTKTQQGGSTSNNSNGTNAQNKSIGEKPVEKKIISVDFGGSGNKLKPPTSQFTTLSINDDKSPRTPLTGKTSQKEQKIFEIKSPMKPAKDEIMEEDDSEDGPIEPLTPMTPKPVEKPKSKVYVPPVLTAADLERQAKRKKQEKELLDAEKKKDDKERLNMVVIGHVDAGKSTLMGHVLYKMGMVSPALMHKYEKECRQMGKPSFHFAWVLDENEEERSRGITVDVAINFFETPKKKVTLLDAPGHRDFIPNMISGAAQADAAILVVPASVGEFESGFQEDGQTKEHAILARSLGVTELIVAINKLDTVDWSQDRYHVISNEVKNFLKSAGFKEKNIWPVPVSGLQGENIKDRKEAKLKWYDGPTLVELIDQFARPERSMDKPFRMAISNIYKSMSLGTTVCGKIEAGAVMSKDKFLLSPMNEVISIKGIEIQGVPVQIASAGDNVDLGIKDYSDINVLTVGQVLCDPRFPIPLVTRFKAQIITMNYKVPILQGSEAILFTATSNQTCHITQLYKVLDKTSGRTLRKKPRALPKNQSAVVEITTRRPTPLELFSSYRQLGRFQLRKGTETLAVGIITKLYSDI